MCLNTRLAHRHGVRRHDGERGASTLEAVIIYPVILLLLFTLIQAGLWYHSRSVALHSANAASSAASAEGAGNDAGYSAATAFVDQTDALRDLNIVVTRNGETVTAIVTGRSPSLVPGLALPLITQSSTSAIERYVP